MPVKSGLDLQVQTSSGADERPGIAYHGSAIDQLPDEPVPSVETLIAFLLATAVFAYMPGPSTLYAAAQTIARGRRGGLMASLGIHTGGYVHVLAAAMGLAVLFDAIPVLYSAMKLAGAAYLIWLGLRFLRSRDPSDLHVPLQANARSPWQAFRESAMVEILNPKTAIFYVAFLPQFTDPAAALPLWSQLLLLGTFVNLMFSSADLLCVLLAERITAAFKHSPGTSQLANRIGGGILIALGINLAATR